MKQGRRSAVLPVLLFSLLCTGVTVYALHVLGVAFVWPFGLMLGWFAAVTLVLLLWQERALGPDLRPFMRRFMAGLVIKLLGSLVLLFLLLWIAPAESTKPMAVSFALLYLAYLGFGTARLVGRMRNQARP
ncbi:MAG: hypothetical protein IPK99_09300 [Flavobacteriales bacterium]|nr:hypothetical protein [Flavobacteriales bacterium]